MAILYVHNAVYKDYNPYDTTRTPNHMMYNQITSHRLFLTVKSEMETLQSAHLQKFFDDFEIAHATLIPQYLKNLLDYCEYSEFTIRFFDEESIKGLEEFVKNEVSKIVSNEEWVRLTGGKFKDFNRFVFFPPVKLLILELAKFSKSTNILPKPCKTEVESIPDEELIRGKATANVGRTYSEGEGAIVTYSKQPQKRLKLESCAQFEEGKISKFLELE